MLGVVTGMSVDDDASAIARCLAGESDAYSVLHRRHAEAVRRYVSARVSDRATIDDVVQDVFVRAYFAIGNLRDPARLRPWLLSIARNACADEHRRRGRFIPLSDDQLEQADEVPTASDLTELTELAGLVRGCVAGMSRRDATALMMVVQLGLSVSELAEALSVSQGSARVILHRARRRLGEALVVSVLASTGGGCDGLEALLAGHEFVRATAHASDCQLCHSVRADAYQRQQV